MKFDFLFKSVKKERTEEEWNTLLFKEPKVYWYSKKPNVMNVAMGSVGGPKFVGKFPQILGRMSVLYKNDRVKLHLNSFPLATFGRIRKFIFETYPTWTYIMMDDDAGLVYDIR